MKWGDRTDDSEAHVHLVREVNLDDLVHTWNSRNLLVLAQNTVQRILLSAVGFFDDAQTAIQEKT